MYDWGIRLFWVSYLWIVLLGSWVLVRELTSDDECASIPTIESAEPYESKGYRL